MSTYSALDLSKVPAPAMVEAIDYETVLSEMVAALSILAPELQDALALESELCRKILQVCAYREVLLRARINDAGRANLLAFATGSDLDNLAALFGVQRLTLDIGDAGALPPIPPVMEADADLRRRAQLSLEGFSTAGPRGAYEFHALKEARVKDVSVTSPEPGNVLVTVLGRTGDGAASVDVVNAVSDILTADDVRPLCDNVIVQTAAIVPYVVTAQITVDDGPDPTAVVSDAVNRLASYVTTSHAIGRAVRLSGIYAALHIAGVSRVTLISPVADIVPSNTEAAFCSGTTVTVAP